MEQKHPLLEISDLSVSFPSHDRAPAQSRLRVISNLSLTAYPGEVLAVAGSSGSGKSLLAAAILGILPGHAAVDGVMRFAGQLLDQERQRRLRGREIALVPQSVDYLDPLIKVGRQADGPWKPRPVQKRRELFLRLGLPADTAERYPFQLSGGMARRVLVSTAMLSGARLVIADEPTPGMELEQAMETLTVFREMAEDGKTVILITHDLDLAVQFADRIAVFYAGTIVELATARDFRQGAGSLYHPHSRALWRALPQNGFEPIPGVQPYAGELPVGCLFAPRCPRRTAECERAVPPMTTVKTGEVRCFHAVRGTKDQLSV